jgi:hypothetical protein
MNAFEQRLRPVIANGIKRRTDQLLLTHFVDAELWHSSRLFSSQTEPNHYWWVVQ